MGEKARRFIIGGNSIEADLSTFRPTGKILDGLCCDGTLHLHLEDGGFRIRYLVDSQALVVLAEIRNGVFAEKPNDLGDYGYEIGA